MMKQPDLFSLPQSLIRTKVISNMKDFGALFDGFSSMRAIIYVASPSLLLELIEKHGYSRLEVVVGENLADQYRKELAERKREVVEQLADYIERGTLSILVPDRTIHTKLYILEATERVRVIQSSANLTETARQATRQVNYAWYADLPPDHPWLQQTVMVDYEAHLKMCTPFMDDLMSLLRQNREADRGELISAWLKGVMSDKQDLETNRTLQEITSGAFEHAMAEEEPVYSIRLPESPQARKRVERFLEPVSPTFTSHEAHVNAPKFLHYFEETIGVPLMKVDLERREVLLGLKGETVSRTAPVPDEASVNVALEHIEQYLRTVDWGESLDPQIVKASMFEALLYVFSSPFANEHMKAKRRQFRMLESRGPQFLYLFGPAQNGKTTFLLFALSLLTGHHMKPYSTGSFTKTKIDRVSSIGSVFPLVFDDVVPSKSGGFEEVLKSYWEVWWREECIFPQIVMSSNAETLKEWAKSRIKRVDLDVYFASSDRNRTRLARILEQENPLFTWFSFLYFDQLLRFESLNDDELEIARRVMKQLYKHANRPLPEFFPEGPVEQLYNPGRRAWQALLHKDQKAKLRREKDRTYVDFSEDMQYGELRQYQGYLPQTVKHQRKGKTIVIESPDNFQNWLNGSSTQRANWLNRLLRR